MLRFLVLFALYLHAASAAYVAISAIDGTVIELDASMFYSFNDHRADFLPLYIPAKAECQQIIDAQLVYTDDTYRISDWFYSVVQTKYDEELQTARETISESVSIVDMDEFTRYAFQMGVWRDHPSCEEIWLRIRLQILQSLFNNIKYPIGSQLYGTFHGLFGAFHCDEDFCTAAQLTERLRASNEITNLRLIE